MRVCHFFLPVAPHPDRGFLAPARRLVGFVQGPAAQDLGQLRRRSSHIPRKASIASTAEELVAIKVRRWPPLLPAGPSASSAGGFLRDVRSANDRERLFPERSCMMRKKIMHTLMVSVVAGLVVILVATAAPLGVPGPTGAAGATGATGEAGPTGSRGANRKCLRGKRGLKGVTGTTGARGVKGALGNTGATGATGRAGTGVFQTWLDMGNERTRADFLLTLVGKPGAIGPKGETGAAGKRGATGAAGTDGARGPQGNTRRGWSSRPERADGRSGCKDRRSGRSSRIEWRSNYAQFSSSGVAVSPGKSGSASTPVLQGPGPWAAAGRRAGTMDDGAVQSHIDRLVLRGRSGPAY